jgi:hypothetical protein
MQVGAGLQKGLDKWSAFSKDMLTVIEEEKNMSLPKCRFEE